MKIAIEIPDSLLQQAKAPAAREGTSVRALVELGLRQVIAQRDGCRTPFRLRDASFKGQGLSAPAMGATWETFRKEAYKGRGGCSE